MQHIITKEGKNAYWGFWATIAFSCGVLIIYFVVQVLAAMVLSSYFGGMGQGEVHSASGRLSGFTGFEFAAATVIAAIPGIALCIFVIRGKENTLGDYLSLNPATGKQTVLWLALTAAVGLSFMGLGELLDRPDTNEFWVYLYETARSLPLFWGAIVIAAPVFEEVLFRGFMFRGIERSRLGVTGAVLITTLGWTVIHLQYDLFDLSNVFVLGLLIAAARVVTGSLYLSIGMHMLNNLFSMLVLAYNLR